MKTILYAGNNKETIRVIRQNPGLKMEHLTNYKDLKEYLSERAAIFSCDDLCGGFVKSDLEGIYPTLFLMDPDLAKSKKSKNTIPAGPATIQAYIDNLSFARAYVISQDDIYDSDLYGLRTCCEKHKTPIIKQSQLEQILKQITTKSRREVKQNE